MKTSRSQRLWRPLTCLGLVLLIVVINTACDDDKSGLTPDDFVATEKNNVRWVGVTEMQLDKATDTLTFFGVGNRPEMEVLVMKIKFAGVGKYTLQYNQGQYYTLLGGDVLTSEYKLGLEEIGSFEIVKYDSVGNMLEGQFQMQLQKHRANPETQVHTLRFTNGIFRGKLMTN